MAPNQPLPELIERTQHLIDTLPPRARSKAHYCFGRRLALSGEAERAALAFVAVSHQPEFDQAQLALREPPRPAKAGSTSPSPQLDALLRHGELRGAKLLIARLQDDFEKVAALTELARTHYAHREKEECRHALLRAETLWRLHRCDWWFFPWLGDHLRTVIDCGEIAWAQGLLAEAEVWVAAEESLWLQIHGWCGLAQGAVRLGKEKCADDCFAQALSSAKGRDTRRARNDARQLVISALFSVGRIDQALCVAQKGGKRQELEALLSALRVASRSVSTWR